MHSLRFLGTLCLFIGLFLPGFTADEEITDETSRHVERCQADELEEWSYRGSNGPVFWYEMYPECHGFSQSPIFIDSGRVEAARNLNKMHFNYWSSFDKPLLRNDGHTIEVLPMDNNWRAVAVANTWFYLRSIHFHWGSVKEMGSEHVVDGIRYPMEMHLVHTSESNVTAVVAVFFEENDHVNAELQHIVNELPKVMYKDTSIRIPYRLDILNLMPENPASFWRYEGSLTTPECTEGVIWSVLRTPNHVGREQMKEFRKLFSSPQNMTENGCRISDNFRPVQHLHRRKVFTSL